jgi:uncharacterized protein (TIGR02611 family)
VPKTKRLRRLIARLHLGGARKPVVAVVGGTVVLVGVAMIVLPGPAFIVIPLGLAILATEFLWARRWLKRAQALLPKGGKPSPPTSKDVAKPAKTP